MPTTDSSVLRRDNCQLAEYEAWFEGECNKLALDPGLTIVGPYTDPLVNLGSAPWRSDLAIIYANGMYIRIVENYCPRLRIDGGGGCLQHLSYHYGPCTDARNDKGFPVFSKEFELRID